MNGLQCPTLRLSSDFTVTRSISHTVIYYFFASPLVLSKLARLEVRGKYTRSDHRALYLSLHEISFMVAQIYNSAENRGGSCGWKFWRLPARLIDETNRSVASIFSLDDARAIWNSAGAAVAWNYLHRCLRKATILFGGSCRVDTGGRSTCGGSGQQQRKIKAKWYWDDGLHS